MPVTIASGHKAGIQQPRFLLGRNDPLPAQQLLGGVLVRAAELGVVLSLFASEETEAWGGNVSAAAEEQCVCLQTDAIGNISPSDVALCFSGWTVRLFFALSFSLPFPAADCGTLKTAFLSACPFWARNVPVLAAALSREGCHQPWSGDRPGQYPCSSAGFGELVGHPCAKFSCQLLYFRCSFQCMAQQLLLGLMGFG